MAEIDAFPDWLADRHFTFLGYHEFDLETQDGVAMPVQVPATRLGTARPTAPMCRRPSPS